MPSYVFGKAIKFRFQPIANNEPVGVDSIVSARIYSATPSNAQIEDAGGATTGHVERVAAWASDEGGKLVTFAAITDPNPFGTTPFETYFVVVNFRYEAAGPEVWAVEAIFVYRPDALTSRINTSVEDICQLHAPLRDIDDAIALERHIVRAKQEVIDRYAALGSELRRMFDLEKLNSVVAYRAAALACISHVTSSGDKWIRLYDEFNAAYDNAFKIAQPGYDLDDDDVPDPVEKVASGPVYVGR